MNPSQLLYIGLATLVLGGTVYALYGTDLFPKAAEAAKSSSSSTSSSTSSGYTKPKKQHHFELSGSTYRLGALLYIHLPSTGPESWSEDDMKKYLTTVSNTFMLDCGQLIIASATWQWATTQERMSSLPWSSPRCMSQRARALTTQWSGPPTT